VGIYVWQTIPTLERFSRCSCLLRAGHTIPDTTLELVHMWEISSVLNVRFPYGLQFLYLRLTSVSHVALLISRDPRGFAPGLMDR
jgi:hypothetical protein